MEIGGIWEGGHAWCWQSFPQKTWWVVPMWTILCSLHQPLYIPYRPLCVTGNLNPPLPRCFFILKFHLWKYFYFLLMFDIMNLVLQPSMEVFNDMLHQLEIGKHNPDGADQGFISSYFPDLLDMPMFHPPLNGTTVNGSYRLPLGYQMEATYYCEWIKNAQILNFFNALNYFYH